MDSFLDLPSQQMARVAADPGGSRVMEAVLQSPAVNAKAKKKLLKKLTGYYGTIASTPAGNFLVEKCYSFAVSSCIVVRDIPAGQDWSMLPQHLRRLYLFRYSVVIFQMRIDVRMHCRESWECWCTSLQVLCNDLLKQLHSCRA